MHQKVQKLVDIPVALAMRYGTMTIQKGLQELQDKGVTEVMLLPLYPQHAMASTTTILVLAEELRQKYFPEMTFTKVPAFYNKPDYIKALANSMKNIWKDLNTIIYCFRITEFRSVIFVKPM